MMRKTIPLLMLTIFLSNVPLSFGANPPIMMLVDINTQPFAFVNQQIFVRVAVQYSNLRWGALDEMESRIELRAKDEFVTAIEDNVIYYVYNHHAYGVYLFTMNVPSTPQALKLECTGFWKPTNSRTWEQSEPQSISITIDVRLPPTARTTSLASTS